MKVQKLGITAAEFDATPFLGGREVAAVNFGAADVTITDSNDSSNTFTVPTSGAATVTLPAKAKASADVYLIGGV